MSGCEAALKLRSGARANSPRAGYISGMKTSTIAGLSLALAALPAQAQQAAAPLDVRTAGRFAALALACVQKEYPNKIAHVLNSPADVKAPHELTPAFYGCYDWHSAVHGHWLLVRLIRSF